MISEVIKLIGACDVVVGRDGYISDPKLFWETDKMSDHLRQKLLRLFKMNITQITSQSGN
ncbi:hypothetical protein [Methanospirillum sp.]|uniref:hypothetical protein n=1 Tax=Methanospirillum sp. TaxID=45200 RepID=UPI0029874D15|nr:hypothetical protein [Methanospirillum sp.]